MKAIGDRSLLIGLILLGAIIAVVTWVVGVSPKIAAAQQAKEDTQAQLDSTDTLRLVLAARMADDALIPEYISELYSIRQRLPADQDVAGMRYVIDELAKDHNLSVVLDQVATPVPVLGQISLSDAAAQVGLTSEIEGLSFTNLVQTPYSFDVSGSLEGIYAMVYDLQSGEGRYFMMSTLTVAEDQGEAGSTGAYTASIGGAFFTLDYGVPGISVAPEVRPWPGFAWGILPKSELDNPFSILTTE